MINGFNRLSEIKDKFGSKLMETVDSLENILKIEPMFLASPMNSKQNTEEYEIEVKRGKIYKAMLIQANYEHIICSDDYQNELIDRDNEILRLKTLIGKNIETKENFSDSDSSNNIESKHKIMEPCSVKKNGLERRVKEAISEKVDAESEAKLYKETSRVLQQQCQILKLKIRTQQDSIVNLKNILKESQDSSSDAAVNSLIKEYSISTSNIENLQTKYSIMVTDNDVLKEKLKEQEILISKYEKERSAHLTQRASSGFGKSASVRMKRYQTLLDRIETRNRKEVQKLEQHFNNLATDTTTTQQLNEKDVKENHKTCLFCSELEEKLDACKENSTLQAEKIKKLEDCAETTKSQKNKLDAELTVLKTKSLSLETLFQEKETIINFNSEEISRLKQLFTDENKRRRKLHNELSNLRGNIRVFCRVRPILNIEIGQEEAVIPSTDCLVKVKSEKNRVKDFEFSRVFNTSSSQSDIFEEVEPLITSVLDGYSVCLFAYGQTGSGKTFTMNGPKENPGVNTRAMKKLFEQKQNDSNYRTEITLSVFEIYNESILDLLSTESKTLDIRLQENGKIYIQDLVCMKCESFNNAEATLEKAQQNRKVGDHKLNSASSRSHLVVRLNVIRTEMISLSTTSSELNLIDLAGSERLSRTEASGETLKEAQSINKSLSALGDVIQALNSTKTSNRHIPFRNSKLTFLLQDCLKENNGGKVAMFLNLSPALSNVSESLCSLNFASRCAKVELGKARKVSKA